MRNISFSSVMFVIISKSDFIIFIETQGDPSLLSSIILTILLGLVSQMVVTLFGMPFIAPLDLLDCLHLSFDISFLTAFLVNMQATTRLHKIFNGK